MDGLTDENAIRASAELQEAETLLKGVDNYELRLDAAPAVSNLQGALDPEDENEDSNRHDVPVSKDATVQEAIQAIEGAERLMGKVSDPNDHLLIRLQVAVLATYLWPDNMPLGEAE